MKKQTRTIIIVLLNVLFCAYLLWFSANNSYLRPFAGSKTRELIAGLILLITLYANYFLLYPKLHKKRPVVYWVALISICIIAAAIDFAIAHRFMMYCNGAIIEEIGAFRFFSHHYKLIVIRNVTLNAFPFIFRERQELQKALDKEVQIVYQDAQLLDVSDKEHNMRLIPNDDIYYCLQDGNYTRIYVTQYNYYYTRYGSMKYLEQLFGQEEFVRISNTLLLPYRQIHSCDGSTVVMKKMPWQKEPLTFTIDPKYANQVADRISLRLLTGTREKPQKQHDQRRKKRKPITPSQEKINAVLSYVKKHPGDRANEIAEQTQISPSTVERSLAELRKQELIVYKGSKKTGGYHATKKTTSLSSPDRGKSSIKETTSLSSPDRGKSSVGETQTSNIARKG